MFEFHFLADYPDRAGYSGDAGNNSRWYLSEHSYKCFIRFLIGDKLMSNIKFLWMERSVSLKVFMTITAPICELD